MDFERHSSAVVPARCVEGEGSGRRILIADDEDDILRFSAEVLMRQGFRVDTAVDGSAAWEALGTGRYDLLITDNRMPKVTGLELIEKVRAARMSLRVIMATGTLPTEEFVRMPWLAPDATLLKPYTSERLVEKVNEILCLIADPRTRKESLQSCRGLPSHSGFAE